MFVYAGFTQLSRFINENIERKQTTKAFLNENLFRKIFFLRIKGVQFLIRDDKRVTDLKELQVQFELEVIKPACRARFSKISQKKKNVRNTKNRSIRKVFKLKYKFTTKPVIS